MDKQFTQSDDSWEWRKPTSQADLDSTLKCSDLMYASTPAVSDKELRIDNIFTHLPDKVWMVCVV